MNTQMIKLEPHFLGAYCANDAAIAVVDMFPDTDLMSSLKNLMYIQHDLMTHMIESKHYGTENIENFIEYTQEVKDEVRRLKDNP